jgi:hypothetical protein
VATAGTTAATSTTEPEPGAVEVLPPDESFAGGTLGEWSARQWQWSESFPADDSPSMSDQGCGFGQFGPVFLLENTGVDRTCVVAEGTAIYVVVADVECSTGEPPPFFGRTEEELRACAAAWADEITDSEASINGDDVGDLDAYRAASPVFTLTFGENNNFGAEPGVVAQAVSEAYSFIIAPPPPGDYELFLSTIYPGQPEPSTTTITLIVEAPQIIEPTGTEPPQASEQADTTQPPSTT